MKIKNLTWCQYGDGNYLMPNQIVKATACTLKQVQAVYNSKDEMYTNHGWFDDTMVRNKPVRFHNAYLTGPAGHVQLKPPVSPAPLVGGMVGIGVDDPCYTERRMNPVRVNDWVELVKDLGETSSQHNLRIVVEDKKSLKAYDPVAGKDRHVRVIDVPMVFCHANWITEGNSEAEAWLYENTPKDKNWWVWNATATSRPIKTKCNKNKWLTSATTCLTVQEVDDEVFVEEQWQRLNEEIDANVGRALLHAQIPDNNRLEFAVF